MASAQNSFNFSSSLPDFTSQYNNQPGVINNENSINNALGWGDSMASQQFNLGDWLSDTFLGTNYQEQKSQDLQAQLQAQVEDYFNDKQNAFTEYMQDKANAFSEQMASTEYQRSVKDMVAAGINPMVMFANNGGSAKDSAPVSAFSGGSAGTAPSMVRAQMKNAGLLGKSMGSLVNNFVGTVGMGGAAKMMGMDNDDSDSTQVKVNHNTGEVEINKGVKKDPGKTFGGIMDTLGKLAGIAKFAV